MTLVFDRKLTREEFANALLDEFRKRTGHPCDEDGADEREAAKMVVETIAAIVQPSIDMLAETTRSLAAEAAKLSRFVGGLSLSAHSIADQREVRERLHALQREIKKVRP